MSNDIYAEMDSGPADERKCTGDSVKEIRRRGDTCMPKTEHSECRKEKQKIDRIYLNLLGGKMITLQCEGCATIADLKGVVELGRGFARSEQRIFCRGKELEDARRIGECDADADVAQEGFINMELRWQPITSHAAHIGANDSSVLRRYL